jgi:lipopolysaccharide/colanic/teichoic acid biosynthesis glycosyltransferase
MKRIFDLLIALLAAPLALVICLIAAIPIAIECRASPFFLQERLGLRERPFKLLKLRTMHTNTPPGGSHEIGQAAILKSGSVIRKFKIDELPQLWNVIAGHMSLVGPRPGLAVQLELTEARRKHCVFGLIPGITGISQVNGIDMSTPWKLAESDARYGGDWSLREDFDLLVRTALGGGSGDAARSNVGR